MSKCPHSLQNSNANPHYVWVYLLYCCVSAFSNMNFMKNELRICMTNKNITPTVIPTFPHPSLYVGDFHCQHVNWGYNTKSPDGESLESWATSNNLGLLYNPNETASFFSSRWNVSTNPDLAFASFGQDSRLPDRRVLGKFPRSQHRPSLAEENVFSYSEFAALNPAELVEIILFGHLKLSKCPSLRLFRQTCLFLSRNIPF